MSVCRPGLLGTDGMFDDLTSLELLTEFKIMTDAVRRMKLRQHLGLDSDGFTEDLCADIDKIAASIFLTLASRMVPPGSDLPMLMGMPTRAAWDDDKSPEWNC